MPVGKASITGSPYLGVYLRVGDSELVGSLLAMNDRGAVVAEDVTEQATEHLERAQLAVTVVRSRLNALGNIILANNRGALCHPDFSPEQRRAVAEALGVPVVPGTIAGLGTGAMAAVATVRGVVVHPRATPHEVEVVEGTLGVPVHRSTANFGVPLVGACLVANSRGFLVGDPTTPVELVHIQEGLKVYD